MRIIKQQIKKFKEETGITLKVKDGKPYYDRSLDLRNTGVTSLPDNLTVKGRLYLHDTGITSLPDNLNVRYDLDLSDTGITALPDNLTAVCGDLNLSGTRITALPDNLTTVCGGLNLSGTCITALPDNLNVGGDLDLSYTGITALPNNLTVEGDLNISHTGITALPDNLNVGSDLNISHTGITDTSKVNRTFNVDFVKKIWEGKPYIKADGIFTRVINHHENVWKVRKINGTEDFYLVTDGEGHYAHGKTIKEAKADLIYKITSRDKSKYENLTQDSVLSFEEAIKCYRTITGACEAGTKYFVESCLDKKDSYTIKEISELTKGRYGNEMFMDFFHFNKSFDLYQSLQKTEIVNEIIYMVLLLLVFSILLFLI